MLLKTATFLFFLISSLGVSAFKNPNSGNSSFSYINDAFKGKKLTVTIIDVSLDRNDTISSDFSNNGEVKLNYNLKENDNLLTMVQVITNSNDSSIKWVTLSKGNIRLDDSKVTTAKYSGSKIMEDYQTMEQALGSSQLEMKKLEAPFNDALATEKMDLIYKYQALYEVQREKFVTAIVVFANKYYQTPIVPFILNSSMESFVTPNDEMELDKLLSSISNLTTKFPHHLRFIQAAEKKTRLTIGKKAPEIQLATRDGKDISLSSLKGKYVLIDFWASWCGPCRKEIPNLKKVYAKYQPKGFEIYGVSIDKDKKRWKSAIDEDNSKWIHVIDEARTSVPQTSNIYMVESIPRTVLIDKNGIIVAKDLRGEAVQQKLEELLK